MPQNFYELAWIFLIYAVIGWCTEVSFAALNRGIFVNRGFLNGPYCPIYGVGVVIVVTALTPLKKNQFLLFLGSLILTTLLEYVTGFVLEKVFHNKWWDYSKKPFNLHGYVCLKFSVYWGLACTFIMDIMHPAIYRFIKMMPYVFGSIVLVVFFTVFFADCAVTVSTILQFNKRLRVMEDMAAKIHKLSDEIGENIYEGLTAAVEKTEEFQETHEQLFTKISDKKDNLLEIQQSAKEKVRLAKQREKEELERRYKELFAKKNFGFQRLMKAFPDMTSTDLNEALQKYKKYFNIRKSDEE